MLPSDILRVFLQFALQMPTFRKRKLSLHLIACELPASYRDRVAKRGIFVGSSHTLTRPVRHELRLRAIVCDRRRLCAILLRYGFAGS